MAFRPKVTKLGNQPANLLSKEGLSNIPLVYFKGYLCKFFQFSLCLCTRGPHSVREVSYRVRPGHHKILEIVCSSGKTNDRRYPSNQENQVSLSRGVQFL